MVRKATKRDVQAIIELLHQVDMVHHVIIQAQHNEV